MLKLLLIGLGGALGTAVRHGVHTWFAARLAGSTALSAVFPWGTFVVNLSGCFAVGFIETLLAPPVGASDARAAWRDILMIGFCGGYTTFSAFGLQAVHLTGTGRHALASAYVLGSCALAMPAVLLGQWTGLALRRAFANPS